MTALPSRVRGRGAVFRLAALRWCSLQPGPQNLSNTPCLSHAAARTMRRLRIKNLADAAHTRVAQMIGKGFEKGAGFCTIGIQRQPGVNEMPDEPGPHSSLMVSSIARQQIAAVVRLIV